MKKSTKGKITKEMNFYVKSFLESAHDYADALDCEFTTTESAKRALVRRHHKAQVAELVLSILKEGK